MPRPPKPPQDRRDSRLTVVMTMSERADLERRAAAVGLTVSEYVRRRSLGAPLPPQAADRATKDKLATALIRIGNNLNQLTRHMNAGKPTPPELGGLLATVRAHLNILNREPR